MTARAKATHSKKQDVYGIIIRDKLREEIPLDGDEYGKK
jgi:hypothetical protein